jgi:hypothetical protein
MRADLGARAKAPESSSPLTLELSLQTVRRLPMDVREARLLPRYRPGQSTVLESRRRDREQAKVLLDRLADDPDGTISLRYEQTKGGDPIELRGLPAIGPSVAGVIPGTNPESVAIARVTRAERIREAIEAAAT